MIILCIESERETIADITSELGDLLTKNSLWYVDGVMSMSGMCVSPAHQCLYTLPSLGCVCLKAHTARPIKADFSTLKLLLMDFNKATVGRLRHTIQS